MGNRDSIIDLVDIENQSLQGAHTKPINSLNLRRNWSNKHRESIFTLRYQISVKDQISVQGDLID